jgi:hypothetical protein
MAKRPVTTADILDGHVSLELQCLDTVYVKRVCAESAAGRAGGAVCGLAGSPFPHGGDKPDR